MDGEKDVPPEGPELTPEEAARQSAQVPYIGLSEELWRISEDSPSGQIVSGQFEVPSGRYIVNWHGDVPPSFDELVKKAAAEQRIEIDVRQTVHSRTALEKAAMELARALADPAGLSVTVRRDGSGLEVSWGAAEGENESTRPSDLDQAVERIRALGIDVTYEKVALRAVDAGRGLIARSVR